MTSKVALLYVLILIVSITSVESSGKPFSIPVKFIPDHVPTSIECDINAGSAESTKKRTPQLQQEYLPTKPGNNATTTALTTPYPSLRGSQHRGSATKEGKRHQAAAACRHPNSTPLLPTSNVVIGSISLGGQPFQVILDTGSTIFWVFGERVGKARKIEMGYKSDVQSNFVHHFYDENRSDAFKLIRDGKFSVTYGDDTVVSGRVGTDTLAFGDNVVIGNKQFGIADTLGGPVPQAILYDGILGLGYRHESNSFAGTINSEGGFLGSTFSVYMSPDRTSGEFMFGGSNDKLYQKPVHFARVVQPPSPPGRSPVLAPWYIKVQNIGVSRGKGSTPSTLVFEEQYALVDTGASHMFLPYDIANTIFAGNKILLKAFDRNSKGYGTVPCDSRYTLPSLTIRLGGGHFELTGREYTAPPSRLGVKYCALYLSRMKKPEEETWTGGGEVRQEDVTIGVPFFRKYYTIFAGEGAGHAGKPAKVGFALAVHPMKRREKGGVDRGGRRNKVVE